MSSNLGSYLPTVGGLDSTITNAQNISTIILINRTLIDCEIFVGQTFVGYLPGQVTDRFDVSGVSGWSGNLTIHALAGSAISTGLSPQLIYAVGFQQGDIVSGTYPSSCANQVQQVSGNIIDIGGIELISNLITPLTYSYILLDHLPINGENPGAAYIQLQQSGALGSGVVNMLINNSTTGLFQLNAGGSIGITAATFMNIIATASNLNLSAAGGNVNIQSGGSNGFKLDSTGIFSFLNANNNISLHGIKSVSGLVGASPINYTHGLGVTPQFVLAICTNAAAVFTVGWNNTIVSLNFGGAPTFSLLIFY